MCPAVVGSLPPPFLRLGSYTEDTLELLCVRFEVGACVIASAWLDNRTDLE